MRFQAPGHMPVPALPPAGSAHGFSGRSPPPRSHTAWTGKGSRAFRVTGLLFVMLVAGQGCINMTIAKVRRGNPIDGQKVYALEPGKSTLDHVLSSLGAPLEVHAHTDGMLLVYRYRARNTFRFGLEVSGATRFIDLTQVISGILENLRFTLELVHADEDRVVILIDKDRVVQGIGYRDKTKELPLF